MRGSFLFIFVFLLCISQVAALSTDAKSVYAAKETMIIKIIGNVVQPIDTSQVIFKRNNIFVPLEYDVRRVGSDWYVWAVAPGTSASYTLTLQNIVTSSGSGVKTENYQKNFSVNGSAEYNIRPGLIISGSDFEIDVEVFSEEETITTNFPTQQQFTLQSGVNTLGFPAGDSGFRMIQLGNYNIPAFFTTTQNQTVVNNTQDQNTTMNTTTQNQTALNNTQTQNATLNTTTQNQTNVTTNVTTNNPVNNTANTTVSVEQQIIQITPSYVQRLMYKEAASSTYEFSIHNPGSVSYKDVQIIYNTSLFKTKDDEFNLKSNTTYSFNVTLGKYPGYDLREIIYLNATNLTIEIPFFVRYTNNASDLITFYGEYERNATTNVTKRATRYYCTELGGVVCGTSSSCKGQALESKEGNCCLGICEQPKSSGGSWWGWLIGIVVLGILVWVYMKYKKAAPSVSIDGIGP